MKVTVELDIDDPTDFLRFQMMEKADSIYFAIKNFDNDDRVDDTSRDILFEAMAEQQDGLLDIFYKDE